MLIRTIGCAVLAAWPSLAAGQASAPAIRVASPSTAAEQATIEAGARLHDQGKFDEAIAKYEEVLKLSPNNMTALYELAYSFAANKDYEKSLAAATRGTEYKSDQLAGFYDLIGSALDSMGEPEKAVEAYRKGIQVMPDAATLYYNMGITYLESLKNPDEARHSLEKAAAIDPTQPAFQLALAQVFQTGGYPTPAFFAFSRYLILEPAGPQSLTAYGFWRAILRGGVETGQGPMNMAKRDTAIVPTDRVAKTDEGDFADFEAAITASQRTVLEQMDNGSEELPAFIAQMERLMTVLSARPPARDRGTFSGANYLPFFAEMKAKNYVEPFVYWAIQRAPVRGVREWVAANQPRLLEFVTWTREYQWPK